MNKMSFNYSIICVDDEQGILDGYRNILQKARNKTYDQVQSMISRRRERKGIQSSGLNTDREEVSYELHLASSGEEAVKIVREELSHGRQIAAGFFDMSMPGGIDGPETIKRILQLDNQMLCAIVTAYTDRSPQQLANLFNRQDDWLYFNKPFTIGELQQTAYHLVAAWNQRREEEALVSNLQMMQNGLLHIINTVSDINKVPPLMVEELIRGILNHFLELINARDGFITFISGRLPKFRVASGLFEDDSSANSELQLDLIAEANKTKKSIVKGDEVASPLLVGQEVVGVIYVQKDKPIEQNSELLDIYAIQAINMIQQSKLYNELDHRNIELSNKNQELVDLLGKLTKAENLKNQFEKLSYMDSLTGIPNRHCVEIRFEEELNRAQRHNLPIACIMIDIDHFKQINDTYGHAAGDYVLREIGRLFKENKRTHEMVGRYGGEEFVMLLEQSNSQEAVNASERFRSIIEKYPFFFSGNTIKVTVSIGATATIPTVDDTIKSILEMADKALYTAKNNGRNRCVLRT